LGVGYYQCFPCPKWKLVSKEKRISGRRNPHNQKTWIEGSSSMKPRLRLVLSSIHWLCKSRQ
jgi:hypothetical protein